MYSDICIYNIYVYNIYLSLHFTPLEFIFIYLICDSTNLVYLSVGVYERVIFYSTFVLHKPNLN